MRSVKILFVADYSAIYTKRMACGLGACLSCSIDTADGRRKVCKDGPVFDAQKVFGDDDA